MNNPGGVHGFFMETYFSVIYKISIFMEPSWIHDGFMNIP